MQISVRVWFKRQTVVVIARRPRLAINCVLHSDDEKIDTFYPRQYSIALY